MFSAVKYLHQAFSNLPVYRASDALYDSLVTHHPDATEYGYPAFFKTLLAGGLLYADLTTSFERGVVPCNVLLMLLQSIDFSKTKFHSDQHTDFLLHLAVRDLIPTVSFVGLNVALSGFDSIMPSLALYTVASKAQQLVAQYYEQYTNNELPAWLNHGGMMHIIYPLAVMLISSMFSKNEKEHTPYFSDLNNCLNNPDATANALATLGLPSTVSWDTIKHQYRTSAKDLYKGNQGNPTDSDALVAMNLAYGCLKKAKAFFS